MPETLKRPPRTVERRVSAILVQYFSRELDGEGREVEMARTARRGELATFSVQEAARLDALGALAPEGHTVEMIKRDIEATYEAWAATRRQPIDDGSGF
jgi:hypothetical protein